MTLKVIVESAAKVLLEEVPALSIILRMNFSDWHVFTNLEQDIGEYLPPAHRRHRANPPLSEGESGECEW